MVSVPALSTSATIQKTVKPLEPASAVLKIRPALLSLFSQVKETSRWFNSFNKWNMAMCSQEWLDFEDANRQQCHQKGHKCIHSMPHFQTTYPAWGSMSDTIVDRVDAENCNWLVHADHMKEGQCTLYSRNALRAGVKVCPGICSIRGWGWRPQVGYKEQ